MSNLKDKIRNLWPSALDWNHWLLLFVLVLGYEVSPQRKRKHLAALQRAELQQEIDADSVKICELQEDLPGIGTGGRIKEEKSVRKRSRSPYFSIFVYFLQISIHSLILVSLTSGWPFSSGSRSVMKASF